MNPLIKMILSNWLTSLPGGALLSVAVPELIDLFSHGATLTSVLQSPALGKALGGIGLLLAKDMNRTGGTKENAP